MRFAPFQESPQFLFIMIYPLLNKSVHTYTIALLSAECNEFKFPSMFPAAHLYSRCQNQVRNSSFTHCCHFTGLHLCWTSPCSLIAYHIGVTRCPCWDSHNTEWHSKISEGFTLLWPHAVFYTALNKVYTSFIGYNKSTQCSLVQSNLHHCFQVAFTKLF